MEHPSESLEQAEHEQHGVHSAFDRRVAMTMAILAAGLACVTMLSHRAHNETLRLQSEAGIFQTKASDQWSFYQAKNIRQHEYEAYLALLAAVAKQSGQEDAAHKAEADWSAQIEKYRGELPEMKGKAEELEHETDERQEQSHHFHQRGSRFDLGALGLEVALVLASLAVLTKQPRFWYVSIAVGVLGALASASGYLVS